MAAATELDNIMGISTITQTMTAATELDNILGISTMPQTMAAATELDNIMGISTMPQTLEDLQLQGQTLSFSMSYSQSVNRPLLDVVDKLRNLNIMKEGIELPSIVVLGDQSSGKSSVLESLAGISLGMYSTRVPLILRLQKSEAEDCGIVIEYKDKKKDITESEIADVLKWVTEEIAESSKGISDASITLHVKRIEAPDLTMVDLPSIAREPEDIYQQISKIVMQYISTKESIILNVLSATEDFRIGESVRMSLQADENGERTLAVVTVTDKVPEGLMDDVNKGLGYAYVRERVGDESHEEATKKEAELFRSHSELNEIDKSLVGVPMLAKRLMRIQAKGIRQFIPDIVKKIDETLLQRQSELRALPHHISNAAEAMIAFMKLMNLLKNSLNKLLIEGDYREFSEEYDMHCAARFREMFESYYQELLSHKTVEDKKHFLVQETRIWEEVKGVGLPNFLPRSVFANLLQNPIEEMLRRSLGLTGEVWQYVERVVAKVIVSNFHSYPRLLKAATRASRALVSKRKEECIRYVNKMIEMEKTMDFTLNPIYLETWTKLLQQKDRFMEGVRRIVEEQNCAPAFSFGAPQPTGFRMSVPTEPVDFSFGVPAQSVTAKSPIDTKTVVVEGIGKVYIGEVMKTPSDRLEVAFDMKMRVIAYWKVVIQRVGDGIPLYLQFVYQNLIKNDLDGEIMKELSGADLSEALGMIMEESPGISARRKDLKKSVDSLIESQKEVVKIICQVGEVE